MEKYSLQFFNDYKSPWSDRNASNAIKDEESDAFEKSIEDAICCIEHRAEKLYHNMLNKI